MSSKSNQTPITIAYKAIGYGLAIIFIMIVIQFVLAMMLIQSGYEYSFEPQAVKDGKPYPNFPGILFISVGIIGILFGILYLLTALLVLIDKPGPAERLVKLVEDWLHAW